MQHTSIPDARFFMDELEKIRTSAREEVPALWNMKDLFVSDFVSLLKQGLSYKKHPGVSDCLGRLFTFLDEGKNAFFESVIEVACEKVGREDDKVPTYLFHLATMIEHSCYYKQGMSGPKLAAHRLKPLDVAA